MHLAVAVGTMLMGAWVLNSPDYDQTPAPQPADQQNPPAAAPANPSSTSPTTSPLRRNASTMERERRAPGESQSRTAGTGNQETTVAQPPQGSADMPSPTDPLSQDELTDQTAPPTSNAPVANTYGGGLRRSLLQHPTAPRGGTRGQQSAYRPMSHGMSATQPTTGQPNQNLAMVGPPVNNVQPADKAFSGYQSQSGVSPYMNLFRRDTMTVDNYTTLVQPQLQQRFLNQQYGRDINSLEQSLRVQGPRIQPTIYRQGQGVATPQFFMSTTGGQYYPGMEQMLQQQQQQQDQQVAPY
jgi:hypothetical protein